VLPPELAAQAREARETLGGAVAAVQRFFSRKRIYTLFLLAIVFLGSGWVASQISKPEGAALGVAARRGGGRLRRVARGGGARRRDRSRRRRRRRRSRRTPPPRRRRAAAARRRPRSSSASRGCCSALENWMERFALVAARVEVAQEDALLLGRNRVPVVVAELFLALARELPDGHGALPQQRVGTPSAACRPAGQGRTASTR